MTNCVRCGREAGGGGYCVQCGLPLGSVDTDTAERPVVPAPGRHTGQPPRTQPPAPPPPAGAPPSNARFPLYADEVPRPAGPRRAGPPPQPPVPVGPRPPVPVGPPPPADPLETTVPRPDRGHRLPMVVVGAAVLLLAVLVGLWLWLQPGPGERPTADDAPSTGAGSGSDGSSPAGDPAGSGGDLLAGVRAEVPAVAPPGRDVQGNPIDYSADNLFDGDPADRLAHARKRRRATSW